MAFTTEINLKGRIEIGQQLAIEETISHQQTIDSARDRLIFNNELIPVEDPIEISDQGLTQGYVVFGQPGAGKTHFTKQIIAQLLSYREKEQDHHFGGLIIDPKGDYPQFVSRGIKQCKHRKLGPIIIHPEMKKPINILHCGLSDDTLAKIIASTCSAAAPGADSYFHNNLATLLSAVLNGYRTMVEVRKTGTSLTLKSLFALICNTTEKEGKTIRGVEKLVGDLEAAAKLKSCNAKQRNQLTQAVNSLKAFLTEEKGYVSEQLFRQAFETCAKLDYLSAVWKTDAPNFYDDIINNGRVVLVSLPPSESYAKVVFTLMKNIFQKVVLDRFSRYHDPKANGKSKPDYATISNAVRPVFLICDEYHLSASDAPQHNIGDSTFLSLARAFGCFSLCATQSLEQLKHSGIGERWEAVMGLFRAKFFFTLGDIATAEYAENIAGKHESIITGSNRSESMGGTTWSNTEEIRDLHQLPRFMLLQQVTRGQTAIVGSLDGGVNELGVYVAKVKGELPWK